MVGNPLHDVIDLTDSSGNTNLSQKNILLAPGAVVGTAALLFWGTGLHPVWWLTWFAPLPILLVSPSLGRGRVFCLAALAWFLGSLNLWYYLLKTIAIPLPIVFLVSAVPAGFFSLAVLQFRRFILRGALWRAVLLFPALWVAYEYLNTVISPHGTFGSLGYTQMDFLPVLQLASLAGIWGMQICKDMDFPALSRQYGAKGAGLLLVPAWDFTLDGWLHGRMAVMRGVESGFTIARAAKQGVLTVSDNRGRILAQQDAATVRFASLLTNAPVRHDDTLYTRWGDWFAWLNIAGLLGLLFRPPCRMDQSVVSDLFDHGRGRLRKHLLKKSFLFGKNSS
jgi:apolipoprotein N-acyltransferase